MDFVEPKKIISPISGQIVEPKIVTVKNGNKIVKEAHWIDPASGTFLRKGIVSIENAEKN